MIAIPLESLREYGFFPVENEEDLSPKSEPSKRKIPFGEYVAFVGGGISLIAKRIRGGVYAPSRAKNINEEVYDAESFGRFDTITDLLDFLVNPRFYGIREKTRKIFVDIATTPRVTKGDEEKFEQKIGRAMGHIVDTYRNNSYDDILLRGRVDIEFELAVQASNNGKGEEYIGGITSRQTLTDLADQTEIKD